MERDRTRTRTSIQPWRPIHSIQNSSKASYSHQQSTKIILWPDIPMSKIWILKKKIKKKEQEWELSYPTWLGNIYDCLGFEKILDLPPLDFWRNHVSLIFLLLGSMGTKKEKNKQQPTLCNSNTKTNTYTHSSTYYNFIT